MLQFLARLYVLRDSQPDRWLSKVSQSLVAFFQSVVVGQHHPQVVERLVFRAMTATRTVRRLTTPPLPRWITPRMRRALLLRAMVR